MRFNVLSYGLIASGALLLLLVGGGWPGHAAGEPWEMFPWTLVGKGETGDRHFIARESIVKLPHRPDNRSYYRKVEFTETRMIDGKPVDMEIADMFVDCKSGMMDTLALIRYFKGIRLEALRIRTEDGKRVTPDTLTEEEFRFVCDNRLPQYLRDKNTPKIRGAHPWR